MKDKLFIFNAYILYPWTDIEEHINGLIESQRVINANVDYPHALVESRVVDVDFRVYIPGACFLICDFCLFVFFSLFYFFKKFSQVFILF